MSTTNRPGITQMEYGSIILDLEREGFSVVGDYKSGNISKGKEPIGVYGGDINKNTVVTVFLSKYERKIFKIFRISR